MNQKRVYHLIEWLVALTACGYLIYRLVIFDDYPALWASLAAMSCWQIGALVLCILLMPVNMSIEAWRWKTLMNGDALLNDANDGMMTWKEAHRQVYYSKLAGLITPWRLGEYPARGVLMCESSTINHQSSITNRDLWSRVLSMGAVGSATMTFAIILAGLGSLGILGTLGTLGNLVSGAYAFLVIAVLFLLILALIFAPRLLRRWAEVSHRLILISTLQSLVRLTCWCAQLYLVLFALDALGSIDQSPITIYQLPIYYLLITITPNVPIAEVGVRGAWAILLFGSVNAAFAGVLLWAINTLLPCLIWPFLTKKEK